jgi:hypothetical protein
MTATHQTPADLVSAARTALARALGRSKPASAAALGRALGYDSIAPGRNVQSWISGETVIPPPAALALQFMASGAPLPSFVIARAAGDRKASQERPAPIVAPPQASPAMILHPTTPADYAAIAANPENVVRFCSNYTRDVPTVAWLSLKNDRLGMTPLEYVRADIANARRRLMQIASLAHT